MNTHEPSSKDVLMKIIKDLEKIGDLQDNPIFQFIMEQLQLIVTPINGRRYKSTLILAAGTSLHIPSCI